MEYDRDADVARAAGGDNAIHPTPKHCRDFLESVRVICHRVVMSKEIKEEWDEHKSNFTRTWLYKMFGARKVEVLPDVSNEGLRRKIQKAALCEKDCQDMMKDAHLLEAAQAADSTIISMDETFHILFSKASSKVGEITAIVWINPDDDHEAATEWLQSGADFRRDWTLGEYEPINKE